MLNQSILEDAEIVSQPDRELEIFADRTMIRKDSKRDRKFAATTMDHYQKPDLGGFMRNHNRVSFVQYPRTRSITDKRHTIQPLSRLDWTLKHPRVPKFTSDPHSREQDQRKQSEELGKITMLKKEIH